MTAPRLPQRRFPGSGARRAAGRPRRGHRRQERQHQGRKDRRAPGAGRRPGNSSDNTTVAALPATDDPDELYRNSYEFILSGDYSTAEAGFRDHIARFPADPKASDAHYWLGESLLGQQKYRDAAEVFLAANRDYPDSAKAPDMLLKLGISLNGLQQREVACATYKEIGKRYPEIVGRAEAARQAGRGAGRVLSAACRHRQRRHFRTIRACAVAARSWPPSRAAAIRWRCCSCSRIISTALREPTRLVAVTVDHGLACRGGRRGAGGRCAVPGAWHRAPDAALDGREAGDGLPAAAREARYRLLAEAAAAEGADLVLTGHTLDDQIETVDDAPGARAGDGRGLAGMAPATLYDGRVWILRPLLGTSRAALRDYLRDRGIAWIDDPTNVDAAYERARVRGDSDRWARAVADRSPTRAARRRIELGANAAAADPDACPARGAGTDRARSRVSPASPTGTLPSMRCASCSLPPAAPSNCPTSRASRRCSTGSGRRASARHCRARWSMRGATRSSCGARTAACRPRSSLAAGGIWDGRFRIGALPAGVTVAAFGLRRCGGDAGERRRQALRRGRTPASLQRARLAVEPALWRDGLCQGLGDRVRRGAANHRALGALPAVLRP